MYYYFITVGEYKYTNTTITAEQTDSTHPVPLGLPKESDIIHVEVFVPKTLQGRETPRGRELTVVSSSEMITVTFLDY